MNPVKYYTPGSKVLDAMALNYRISAQLGLFKIKMNFDTSTTIEELCYRNNVHPDLFVLVSNLYVFDDYEVEGDDACIPIEVLFEFILEEHKHFIYEAIDDARQEMAGALNALPAETKEMLTVYFEQLAEKTAGFAGDVDRYINSLLDCDISLKPTLIRTFLIRQEEIDQCLELFLTLLTQSAPFFNESKKYFRIISYFLSFRKNMTLHHRIKSVVWKRIMNVNRKMEKVLAN